MIKRIVLGLTLIFFLSSCSSTKSNVDEGDNFDITVTSREDGSGTRKSFIEQTGLVKKGKNGEEEDMTTDNSMVVNSTNGAIKAVSIDKTAIAYVSLTALDDSVKPVKIEGVIPSKKTIESGEYKLQRPFSLVYDKENLSDVANDFLEFIKSKEVKDIIEKNDLVALSTEKSYQSKNLEGKLTITGSSSLSSIMEKLSEKYESLNKDVDIEVLSNESLTGLKNVKDNVVDLAMVSNKLSDESLSFEVFAIDGIAIIVNKENNFINDLSIKELRDIYKGEIINTGELKK
ncbi:phosphate ABC transporter substrate-binding protein [Anaerococcus sp. WCA-380-WT-2B]|uniref:Phosphate ABC transporter substrate-binding protein n=1 Tax=Anaerococcus porci TaxID=2652269 RepID=A0A6N7VTB0_9FIRM|nr:substrate-binding domain-containing protein [Anaerococcus porci]MSS77313.1 phosphate ABC transporter substrate-binding protein [Anaerococcus porci]